MLADLSDRKIGRIIWQRNKCVLRKIYESVDWISMDQDWVQL
jgi:hypothetical protein